jgi:chemotaxis protein methyltransferase CheR
MVATALHTQPDDLDLATFNRLASFIYDYAGIKMPANKVTMLEGRLRRRLRDTGIDTFREYCEFLFSPAGEDERVHFIDAVTTNKTDFFREPQHFEILTKRVLPEFAREGHRDIRVWSSACSTGAEPYTLAMVLEEAVVGRQIDSYSILATDLSTEVLDQALRGIYDADFLAPVPKDLASKYVMRPIASNRPERRISPRLRQRIAFARMNLMDESYLVGQAMHVIFCRNVLIYFDKQTQTKVLHRLCDRLAPGGYLFIGHSESIAGMNLPVRQIANTVFRKNER